MCLNIARTWPTAMPDAIVCFAIAALMGVYLVYVGGWPILLLGVLSIAAGWGYTGGLHMLLRLVQGEWPPAPVPTSPQERFRWELSDAYGQWLSDARGLASQTIPNRRAEA
jgi:hypothetical protein